MSHLSEESKTGPWCAANEYTGGDAMRAEVQVPSVQRSTALPSHPHTQSASAELSTSSVLHSQLSSSRRRTRTLIRMLMQTTLFAAM